MPRHPYEWRTRLRERLPWFLINLGVAAKGDDCEAVGAEHQWYNVDDKVSGCYHCKVQRAGRLWEVDKRRVDIARKQLATILDYLAEGSMEIEQALVEFQRIEAPSHDDDFNDGYHFMKHFESDADIRSRDTNYAASQKAGLRSIAQRLRSVE